MAEIAYGHAPKRGSVSHICSSERRSQSRENKRVCSTNAGGCTVFTRMSKRKAKAKRGSAIFFRRRMGAGKTSKKKRAPAATPKNTPRVSVMRMAYRNKSERAPYAIFHHPFAFRNQTIAKGRRTDKNMAKKMVFPKVA